MSDTTAPATHVTVAAPSFFSMVQWAPVSKAAATVAVAAAVFYMELTGHAPTGTFLNYVALPVLGFMGLHTAATRMQGTPNA
jgi:hypothetical protein